ncbi:hypothetical protein DOFOFD_02465 [Acetobacteraceae bacterium EV16P]|uniref:Uncharacterized protein n=1 Tax=Sorlinia euscelidii TaxID=3081148 RepID=A0ABU7TZA3_9PROT
MPGRQLFFNRVRNDRGFKLQYPEIGIIFLLTDEERVKITLTLHRQALPTICECAFPKYRNVSVSVDQYDVRRASINITFFDNCCDIAALRLLSYQGANPEFCFQSHVIYQGS